MVALRDRFSPKLFDSSEIEPAVVASIIETTSWAPSAYNEQPWYFHVAHRQDSTAFTAFLEVLSTGNQTWAKTASALIFSVAQRERDRDGLKNDYAFYDTGQAVAHMTFAALEAGLQLHQMQGFSPAKARHLLALPTGIDPVTAIALGRPAPDQTADVPHRTRKEVHSIYQVHTSGSA